jgi:hypothetical protein
MVESRWAILKCRFSDDTSETPPDAIYERLFTSVGVGSSNMVDFFRDVSHGQLDLRRSQVFGWFTLPLRKADYAGNVADSALATGQVNRWGLFFACRSAAESTGVRLSEFAGVVVTMNRGGPWPSGSDGVDLWGAAGGSVFCDRYSLMPSLLGQEMGHGYGLNHSREVGSTEDYRDPWDTMSTQDAYMQPHSEYMFIGPGLSAANMRSRGWLDESRVWRGGPRSSEATVTLRPLHRADLSGLLALDLPDPDYPDRRWLVEFRNKQRWDGAIPEPAVLIHRLDGGISYLVPGPVPRRTHLRAADVIERGVRDNPLSSYFRLEVVAIDAAAETCDLRLTYRRVRDPFESTIATAWVQVLGGILADGGGLIITPHGVVPVGPWDPMLRIAQQVVLFQSIVQVSDAQARESAQRNALETILKEARGALERLPSTKVPYFKDKGQNPP